MFRIGELSTFIFIVFNFFSIYYFCLPASGRVVTIKTVRQEGPGSNPGRACRPSRSEFSVVSSETRVNTGQDPLERTPRRVLHPQAQVPRETIGLKIYNPTLSRNIFAFCAFTVFQKTLLITRIVLQKYLKFSLNSKQKVKFVSSKFV